MVEMAVHGVPVQAVVDTKAEVIMFCPSASKMSWIHKPLIKQ
jgi:hypothetical protein